MSDSNSMNPLRYPLDPYLIALYIMGIAGPALIYRGSYVYSEGHFVDSLPAVIFGFVILLVGILFIVIAVVGILHKVISDAIADGISRGQNA